MCFVTGFENSIGFTWAIGIYPYLQIKYSYTAEEDRWRYFIDGDVREKETYSLSFNPRAHAGRDS